MRKLKVLLAALLSLITIHTTAAAANPAKKAPSRKGGLAINVSGGGWGNAQSQDIEILLRSALSLALRMCAGHSTRLASRSSSRKASPWPPASFASGCQNLPRNGAKGLELS